MTDAASAPRLSIALASAAALVYEILLLRLFSITQFHHTAYLVISLALLGYGASGAVLTSWGQRWAARFADVYVMLLSLAALAMPACFAAAQRVMVHPEEMLWVPHEALRLSLVYVLLAVPFLGVGAALGLALMMFRPRSVYAWDLGGAGVGSVLVVALLWRFQPQRVLILAALLLLAAALLGARSPDPGAGRRLGAVMAAALAIWALPGSWIEPVLSPYKGLSQALRIQGARVVGEHSSPLALVSVLENPVVPLRHAPGLSLAAPAAPADQIGLFLDGDTLTPIARAAEPEALAYLGFMSAAVPYHVRPPGSALILGAGGGEGVLRAAMAGTATIVGIEINPEIIRLLREDYRDFSGALYSRPGVEIVNTDIRGFATRDRRRFDLVEMVALAGVGSGGPALASLSESFLSTVEALGLYVDRLAPGGLLSLTVSVKNPPRDAIKLAATAIAALERHGIESVGDHLAMIRGWQTATLLVTQQPFTSAEIERLRRFCAQRFFDPVFFPGMEEAEANRYNRLDRPRFHQAVVDLLGPNRHAFLSSYAFDVEPATDDRPFFSQFFRWSSLSGILDTRGRGGLSLLEAGYLVLVVTLLQGLVLGGVLVLVPWLALRRSGVGAAGGVSSSKLIVFFAALGLGFLFLEVAFLQKFILLLHHPVYSAAVVLASFLVFAGLGSAASGTLVRRWGSRAIALAAGCVAVLGLTTLLLFEIVAPLAAAAPMALRVAVSIVLIAPMAFFMGMPFPLGLAQLERQAPRLVPWAWGVNGCASVVSPVLATLLAIHFGFGAVVVLAAVAYAAATVVGWRPWVSA